MPKFKVTLKRYLRQTADVVIDVPDGEAPVIPDIHDPKIVWTNLESIPLSADVGPVVEAVEEV